MSRLGLPPLALYVHIPWCLKKCPYCDFNSHAVGADLPDADYTQRLLADLDRDLEYVQGRELASIFIGGGTPSLFTPATFDTLLAGIERRIPFAAAIEITLEANPGTFEVKKFRGFRTAGINRLSLGIQSLEPASLKVLGRVHDAGEARRAIAGARAAGFDNFNLDLMFALPGQATAQVLADLAGALAFSPPHLSWYQLTIEPNTAFYSRPPELPGDDLAGEMQEAGIDLLAAHGLGRYEISAFGEDGRQARHNLNYWRFGDYLGIGAGAHGKITLPATGRLLRTRKVRQPAAYLARTDNFTAEAASIAAADLPLEFMMNALRLAGGVEPALFGERTGLADAAIAAPLARLREKGLLLPDRLGATARGMALLNDVLGEFLPAGESGRIPLHSA